MSTPRERRLGWMGVVVATVAVAVLSSLAVPATNGLDVGRSFGPVSAGIAARPASEPIVVSAGSGSPSFYVGHYWAGALYSGVNNTSRQVAMTMTVPNAIPNSQEFYYVLLSVFDSAGSYDQVGFSNDYGTWGFTYEYQQPCGGTNAGLNADAFNLNPGGTYTFMMNLSGKGDITFAAKEGANYAGSAKAVTHGKYFSLQSKYHCGANSFYDYTDYEEVYRSVQAMPSFDFAFTANTQNNSSVTSWKILTVSVPKGVGPVGIYGSQVRIENEAFKLSFGLGHRHPVQLTNGTTSFNSSIKVHRLFNGTNVTLTASGPTSTFGVTFSPSSGRPGFVSSISISIGAVTPGVWYKLTLTATDGSGNYTYLTLFIKVG